MTILTALAEYYESRRAWTLELEHLGLPGAERLAADPNKFPKPEIKDIHRRTAFPIALCVLTEFNGEPEFHFLKVPCTPQNGFDLTDRLVRQGVHPLDIKICTWEFTKDASHAEARRRRKTGEETGYWTMKTAVDHLFWNSRKQQELERELAANAQTSID